MQSPLPRVRPSNYDQYLPTWSEIYARMGERPPQRKRARDPIHGGDSPYSVALNEERGLFFCHVCHAGGDRLESVKQALKVDFPGALRTPLSRLWRRLEF